MVGKAGKEMMTSFTPAHFGEAWENMWWACTYSFSSFRSYRCGAYPSTLCAIANVLISLAMIDDPPGTRTTLMKARTRNFLRASVDRCFVIHSLFLYIYKSEHDDVEHMSEFFIDLEIGIPFCACDAPLSSM